MNAALNYPIVAQEQPSPATPAAGHVLLYPKSDGMWYMMDDTGTETALGGGTLPTLNAAEVLGRAAGSGSGAPVAVTAAQLAAILSDFSGVEFSNYLTKVEANANTSFTITTADTGKVMRMTAATAITLTLSGTATVGTSLTVVQYGAGQVTFAAGSGALLRQRLSQLATAGLYAAVSLTVIANVGGSAAEWLITGDTTW